MKLLSSSSCKSAAFYVIVANAAVKQVNGVTFATNYGSTSSLSTSQDAEYSCEITNLWNANRHPRMYPTDASWSAGVLLSHSSGYHLFGPGDMATSGIKTLAETGEASNLVTEFDQEGSSIGQYVIGQPILLFNDEDSQTLPSITVSTSTPRLSAIIRAEPTPDWFSGFYDFDPRSGSNWYSTFTIETYPWDAGTEKGDEYETENDPESPQKAISQLLPSAINAGTGAFLSDSTEEVRAVLQWECKLTNGGDDTGGTSSGTGSGGSEGGSDGSSGAVSLTSISAVVIFATTMLLMAF